MRINLDAVILKLSIQHFKTSVNVCFRIYQFPLNDNFSKQFKVYFYRLLSVLLLFYYYLAIYNFVITNG